METKLKTVTFLESPVLVSHNSQRKKCYSKFCTKNKPSNGHCYILWFLGYKLHFFISLPESESDKIAVYSCCNLSDCFGWKMDVLTPLQCLKKCKHLTWWIILVGLWKRLHLNAGTRGHERHTAFQMSFYIHVVLAVQPLGGLNDDESLVAGIKGHIGMASEFSTWMPKKN